MEPGLGAVIFLTFCIIAVFSLGAFLIYRVMTKPGAHIGSRLPEYDPDSAEDPAAEAAPTEPSPRDSPAGRDLLDGPDDPDSPDDREDRNGPRGPDRR